MRRTLKLVVSVDEGASTESCAISQYHIVFNLIDQCAGRGVR